MRYHRRISLGKHIKLNISKSGISTSIKIGGLTINPQRNTYSYNTPIKGLSVRGKLNEQPKPSAKELRDAEKKLRDIQTTLVKQLTDCNTDITNWVNACKECEVEDSRIYANAEKIKQGLELNLKKLTLNELDDEVRGNNLYCIEVLKELKKIIRADTYHFKDNSNFELIRTQTVTFKTINDYIKLLDKAKAKGVC